MPSKDLIALAERGKRAPLDLSVVLNSPKYLERFLSRIDKTPGFGPNGDCWRWTGTISRMGYGVIKVIVAEKVDRPLGAHRISLALHTPLPDPALHALHSCDNPPCVNPAHLRWGTTQENTEDARKRGRLFSCRGHRIGVKNTQARLTEDDVRAIRADPRPRREVAKSYGISPGQVDHIRKRRGWRHVE